MSNVILETKQKFSELLERAVQAAIERDEIKEAPIPDFTVTVPLNPSHGDLSTNIAMVSARAFSQSPRKIAELICANLELSDSFFERVEIAGAGFINVFLSAGFYSAVVSEIIEQGENFGRTDYYGGKKVMVEFVSANPTGPMHIGNSRGGALGDCLAEVLRFAGCDVTREFYVNDAGNQIEKFAASLSARYMQLCLGEEAYEFPADGYPGEDIKAHAKAFFDINGDSLVNDDEEVRKHALVKYALPINIDAMKAGMAAYRIFYDVWFYESTLHKGGEVEKIIAKLREKGAIYEKDGATWYNATEYGAEKDEVLVRANGLPTYFAVDIAYHYNKFEERGFEKVINVWGADHYGHVARLKGAVKALGLDETRLDIVITQMVRLMQDGEVVRIGKRKGQVITLSTLLDEVPLDAARFFFNLREANTHLDFDMSLAVEKSSENPVYYVQYAHARICSIIENMAKENVAAPGADREIIFTRAEEKELISHLAELPNEIILAAKSYDPSMITKYAIAVATRFHKFYNSCRVKGEAEDVMLSRLALCAATRTVLRNVLAILKVSAPESM